MSKNLIIFPAIDIMGGKVVRLFQGQFNRVTEYSNNPLEMAQYWKSQGAQWLHIVDLDGAKTGEMANIKIIKEIAQKVGIPAQVGGGVRNAERVEDLLKNGIQRVVLGTKAIEDKNLMDHVVKHWPDKIAVSVDCAQGLVTQRGWVEMTKVKGVDLAKQLVEQGIKYIIYTDIQCDGTLGGPNLREIENILKNINISVIASGGISDINDIYYLYELIEKYPHLVGAIVGRAIYEDELKFKEALMMSENYEKRKAIIHNSKRLDYF